MENGGSLGSGVENAVWRRKVETSSISGGQVRFRGTIIYFSEEFSS
jgi:hypothetical protein